MNWDLLKELTQAWGVSGRENEVLQIIGGQVFEFDVLDLVTLNMS